MRQEQPEVFRAAATFVSIKDLVLERMTGERCTDLSMASAMGLFDIRKHVWDGEALEIAGISAKRLPAVAEPTTVFSRLSKGAAESTGLPRDTPVIIGAGDGFLANLGSGAVGRGQANLTIGTSLGLRTITAQPYTDPNGGTFCYAATSDRWLVGCAGSSGGIALDWLARLLNASDDKAWHDAIVAKALGLSPGSNGLICLPYVVGERAPQRNAESRGVFFGFGLHHSQEHFWRAALEGIFLVARGMLGSIVRLTGPIDDIRASGGVLRERAVASILAACLGQPVSTLASYNASALGSVLLALVALGEYAQIEDTGHLVDTVTTACTSKDAEAYARLAEKSDALYSSTVALVAG
jgi:gluconokinase